jgi:hypothetical protein
MQTPAINEVNLFALSTNKIKNRYLKDKIFKKIVDGMVSQGAIDNHSPTIEAFIDTLVNMSPISVNITDFFHKRKPEYDPMATGEQLNTVKYVQDQQNKTFMNNFWRGFNKYHNDFKIYQYLLERIYRYEFIARFRADDNEFDFFKYYDTLFSDEKYIANRGWKQRNGVAGAYEYAYKSIWEAKVEGVYQENYFFKLTEYSNEGEMYHGACINPEDSSFVPDPNYNPFPPTYDAPYDPPPQQPFCDDPATCQCTNPGRNINHFIISTTVGDEIENFVEPFKYYVEGSLLPIFFNTMVRDLAHPVGYVSDYKRMFETVWEDYFNLEIFVWADVLGVKSLCHNGDCSNQNVDYYWSNKGHDTISGSPLIKVSQYQDYFKGKSYDVIKFLMKNGDFLLEKTQRTSEDIEIDYYNNDFTGYLNLIPNGDFDQDTDWSLGSRWSIDTNNGVAILDPNGDVADSILSQNFYFSSYNRYVIEVNANSINGTIECKIDDLYVMKIKNPGKHYIRYKVGKNRTQNISFYDAEGGTSAELDFIKVYEDIPTKEYPAATHSSILLEGFKTLRPQILTRDEFGLECGFGNNPGDITDGDDMNDLSPFIPEYPVIGDNISIYYEIAGKYPWIIGCTDPNDRPLPPYTHPEQCCQENDPWNPNGNCVKGETFTGNTNLRYVTDDFIIESAPEKQQSPLVDAYVFDNKWNIVSGNAEIINGVLSQDGTEVSIIERELDICPNDKEVIVTNIQSINTPTGTNIELNVAYTENDDTVIGSADVRIFNGFVNFGYFIDNSTCTDTAKTKIRLTLPKYFRSSLTSPKIYKLV